MATQRKPPAMPNGTTTASTSKVSITPTRRRSPFLPTQSEALLLALYPITLLLGSTFSVISPLTRNTAYSAALQSHPADVAPSYFATKRNIFNLYFVKIGWFWSSIALFLLLLTHPSFGPLSRGINRKTLGVALRWMGATVWWAAVTQWFFGPPLIDRGFTVTGGACERLASPSVQAGMSEGEMIVTSAACRAVGGQWRGGHDISGHVFLLILGSAMLVYETVPLLQLDWWRDERVIVEADGKVRGVAADAQTKTQLAGDWSLEKVGVWGAIGVAGLSWWMLLMTATFFHTWFEKFTGLLVALAAIWTVYYAPRGVPALRGFVGMPGL